MRNKKSKYVESMENKAMYYEKKYRQQYEMTENEKMKIMQGYEDVAMSDKYGDRDFKNMIMGIAKEGKAEEASKRTEHVTEGRHYLMPTEIRKNSNLGVIKAFFSGRVNSNVMPIKLEDSPFLVLSFENEDDAAVYKVSGWESEILELLSYA